MSLTDKVAIVSGAGRGIGRAIAARLATEGASVLLFARTESELQAATEEITKAGELAVCVCLCDCVRLGGLSCM
jgi:NAD(P)-dependent dehydrogenase (short-subunit alcohol dehydrogenase family)